MHNERLDMNLLRLFEAVYRLGSVSRAAEALGLSQPAASQGLSRLRLALGDALFVRAGRRMRPTPRAERLAGGVQPALAAIDNALHGEDRFDPARSTMTLRLHIRHRRGPAAARVHGGAAPRGAGHTGAPRRCRKRTSPMRSRPVRSTSRSVSCLR